LEILLCRHYWYHPHTHTTDGQQKTYH